MEPNTDWYMSDDVNSFNLYNSIVDSTAVVGEWSHLADSHMVVAFEAV